MYRATATVWTPAALGMPVITVRPSTAAEVPGCNSRDICKSRCVCNSRDASNRRDAINMRDFINIGTAGLKAIAGTSAEQECQRKIRTTSTAISGACGIRDVSNNRESIDFRDYVHSRNISNREYPSNKKEH